MHEENNGRLRQLLSEQRGEKSEVIVLHQDDRILGVDFIHNRSRKLLVHGFVFFNKEKGLLISPDEAAIIHGVDSLIKLPYSEVVKNYSIFKLEETLEKGTALI